MANLVTIEEVNYFGDKGNVRDYNAKALYRKNGKLYLCHIHIDFFNKRIFTTKQPKEGKVLVGFQSAINEYGKEHYNF